MITLQEVLIETLWNVKRIAIRSSFFACKVLIETLWNVKELTVSMVNPSFRINRNIVKCKDAT